METKLFIAGLFLLIAAVIGGWMVQSALTNADAPAPSETTQETSSTQPDARTTEDDSVISEIIDEDLTDDVDLGSVVADNTQPTTTDTTTSGSTTPSTTTTETSTTPSGITLTELAKHSTQKDCWVGYKGQVYDVTKFLPRHPGGVSTISRYCGTNTEFTAAINRQHRTKQDARLAREAPVMGALA